MAKVVIGLSMSLDGFIAGPNDGLEQPLGKGGMRLFDWYFSGDTTIRRYEAARQRGVSVPPFRLASSSAALFEELVEKGGAIVTGRRTYDIANGWHGHGPVPGLPVFIVTHHVPSEVPQGESRYTFVTDGVESAIKQAKEAAGDRYVSLMGSAVPQQALRAGLVDEIFIHLVPVLLGGGVRLFDNVGAMRLLETVRVVDAPGVTHLWFRVQSNDSAS